MKKVSIIIPIYNLEHYLATCLDTVINQSYENIEIICVNDGSTDSSAGILEQYSKIDRIIVINQSNQGLSAARNTGVDASSGDYIMFVDSDDYISTNAVERLVNHAEYTQSDIVLFDYVNKNEQNNRREVLSNRNILNNYITRAFNIETIDPYIYNKIPVMTWLKFYRSDFIKNKIYHKSGIIFEDVLFWSEVFIKAKRITYLPEILYSYLINRSGSIMQNYGVKVFELISIYAAIIEKFKNAGYWDRYADIINLSMMMDFGLRYTNISNELKEEFYKRIRGLELDIDYEIYNNSDYSEIEKAYVQYFKSLNTTEYSLFKECKLEVVQ